MIIIHRERGTRSGEELHPQSLRIGWSVMSAVDVADVFYHVTRAWFSPLLKTSRPVIMPPPLIGGGIKR